MDSASIPYMLQVCHPVKHRLEGQKLLPDSHAAWFWDMTQVHPSEAFS